MHSLFNFFRFGRPTVIPFIVHTLCMHSSFLPKFVQHTTYIESSLVIYSPLLSVYQAFQATVSYTSSMMRNVLITVKERPPFVIKIKMAAFVVVEYVTSAPQMTVLKNESTSYKSSAWAPAFTGTHASGRAGQHFDKSRCSCPI